MCTAHFKIRPSGELNISSMVVQFLHKEADSAARVLREADRATRS